MRLDRRELGALREKYREMKRLREHDLAERAGEAEKVDPKPAMRALAARFPGALREIDVLPMSAIEDRIAALDHALAGRDPEPWMLALARYHAWLRLALRLRRAIAAARSIRVARELLERDRREPGEPSEVDDAALRAILRPPGGRLNRAIFAIVAVELETSAAAIERAIAPPRPRE